MDRKILAAIAVLGATAAMSLAPAIAQASPHWYLNGKLLTGKAAAIKTSGTLTFSNPVIPPVTCTLKDVDMLENPASGGAGVDSMTKFKLSKCGPSPCPATKSGKAAPLSVTAPNLPWATELVEVPPIADEIKGMELVFSCKGTGTILVVNGTLSPWVGASLLEFNSPVTGTLGGLYVNGIDTFTSIPVSAKNP